MSQDDNYAVLEAFKTVSSYHIAIFTSVSGASHYIECVTPAGTHRRPLAYTHTAKKVSQPLAMLRNSQVASSRREIPKITCFIVLFLFCKLSLASLLSPVATQWCLVSILLCWSPLYITNMPGINKNCQNKCYHGCFITQEIRPFHKLTLDNLKNWYKIMFVGIFCANICTKLKQSPI